MANITIPSAFPVSGVTGYARLQNGSNPSEQHMSGTAPDSKTLAQNLPVPVGVHGVLYFDTASDNWGYLPLPQIPATATIQEIL